MDDEIRNILGIDVTARMTKTKIDSKIKAGKQADFIKGQGLRGEVLMIVIVSTGTIRELIGTVIDEIGDGEMITEVDPKVEKWVIVN